MESPWPDFPAQTYKDCEQTATKSEPKFSTRCKKAHLNKAAQIWQNTIQEQSELISFIYSERKTLTEKRHRDNSSHIKQINY